MAWSARAPIRLVPPDTSGDAPAIPASIDELFRKYARYVGSIGLRLLGRPDEIDDLVQDVFLSAQRGLHQVREPGQIKFWLASITVRIVARRLRRRRLRELIGLGSDFDYALVADPALSPEDGAILAELYHKLDRLPASLRLAWSLRDVEGEELEDVAALCQCSLATA